MPVGQMPIGGATVFGPEHYTYKEGQPSLNAWASAGDNTGQNTEDTHPIPWYKLKFMTPPGIEPGPLRRVGRQWLYRLRQGDGLFSFHLIENDYFNFLGSVRLYSINHAPLNEFSVRCRSTVTSMFLIPAHKCADFRSVVSRDLRHIERR